MTIKRYFIFDPVTLVINNRHSCVHHHHQFQVSGWEATPDILSKISVNVAVLIQIGLPSLRDTCTTQHEPYGETFLFLH